MALSDNCTSKLAIALADPDAAAELIANQSITTASADGAITLKSGTVFITKASAAALTLANPTATADDGKHLTILATTAAAHTVSNAAGGGSTGGGAGADVGTFGGAKGDNIRLVAYQGAWYVASAINVTLG